MSQTVTAVDTSMAGREVDYSVDELRAMEPIGKPLPEIPAWETFSVSSRIVDSAPPVREEPPRTAWDKIKDLLKGPAVRASERLSGFAGKYYAVNAQGQVIETTVERTGVRKSDE